MTRRSYRVLHGFQASAGQPGLISRSLKEIGVDAFNVVIGPNRFGYPADVEIADASRTSMREILTEHAGNSDIIHIHAITPFFVRGMPNFPMGTDLLALKAAGKRVVVHFRGSEIRLASVFRAKSPFHYVEDDPDGLIAKFPEDAQRAYIELCRSLADEIVVSDPELLSYVPDAKIIMRAIDMNNWKRVKPSKSHRPLVVHAPSRQGVKGTLHVLAAVEALKSEGISFDFRLVEGMPQEEARKLYEQSDIIVDQLRIGWYGVLAVEGMALGKAVVSYIREDLVDGFDEDLPVQNATPDTIKDVLRELIQYPELRSRVAERGYNYCHHNHDSTLVAQACAGLYDEIISRPTTVDLRAYMAVNERQETFFQQALIDAKKRGAARARAAPPIAIERATPYWRKVHNLYRKVGPRSFLLMAAKKAFGEKTR